MDAELSCFLTLQSLGQQPAPGETCVAAVQRLALEADKVLRPYRYQQADGMRTAYQVWRTPWKPSGVPEADVLNAFQAGYTARDMRG